MGPEVTRWRPGDRVTVPFVCGCGRCEHCRSGDAQVCPEQTQPGFTGPGSFAELVALHAADTNLVRLPDSVDFVTAASLGCRFATAYRALTAHGRLRAGDGLAVHGCGGVGLSAVMVGVALGARVVGVDVSPAARAKALALGAEAAVDPVVEDPVQAVRRLLGEGAHVSLDAVGSPDTAVASVRCLRRRGRHVQVGLLLGEAASSRAADGPGRRPGASVHGSHGMAAADYPGLLALVVAGTLRPDLLVGRVVGPRWGGGRADGDGRAGHGGRHDRRTAALTARSGSRPAPRRGTARWLPRLSVPGVGKASGIHSLSPPRVIRAETEPDMSLEQPGGLSPEELDAQEVTALPDKEVVSLLDLNVDLDLAIDAAAPIDLAVAANANVAAPDRRGGRCERAVRRLRRAGPVRPGRADRPRASTPTRSRTPPRTAPSTSPTTSSTAAPRDPGTTGRGTPPIRGTTDGGTTDWRRHHRPDPAGRPRWLDGNLLNVNVNVDADTDIAAPVDGAVAANANVAAPIDAAVAANVGSVDSTRRPSRSRTRSSTSTSRARPRRATDQTVRHHPVAPDDRAAHRRPPGAAPIHGASRGTGVAPRRSSAPTCRARGRRPS